MMRSRIAVLLCFLAAPLAAADWQAAPESHSLTFHGMQQGEGFDGRFARFEAAIRFDPDHLSSARFEVDIDLTSADTRSDERDEVLLGSDFFFVRRFPGARFVTHTFEAEGDDRYLAKAELTIRDRTVAIDFPFRWQAEDEGARILAEVTLDRVAFGLGDNEDWLDADTVGHEVVVRVDLPLRPAR
ncbi:MAG TPA: YceI family protein [Xanthomonadaceae bacterium]|nr:YceI family protein [Xanthomonadaceae bacterium]